MLIYNILFESKQAITNLGFPEIISTILYEKYGNKAFLIAKWFKEDNSHHSNEYNKGQWWKSKYEDYGSLQKNVGIFVKFYNAAKISLDEYNKIRVQEEFRPLETYNKLETLTSIKEELKKEFFEDMFFNSNIIKAITDGSLKILSAYKDLPFQQASDKFEEKKIFKDKKPIKKYKNGWLWVDGGQKCDVVGKKMRNCGSTGAMSMDPNNTMFVLFDEHNNPHVIATYSPSEHRISGVEGGASTDIKDEYADYVLDLIKTLGAKLYTSTNKTKFLTLKYQYPNSKITRIIGPERMSTTEIFLLQMEDGKQYYSNYYNYILVEDFNKINWETIYPNNPNPDKKFKFRIFDNFYDLDKIKYSQPEIVIISNFQFEKLYNATPSAEKLLENIIFSNT